MFLYTHRLASVVRPWSVAAAWAVLLAAAAPSLAADPIAGIGPAGDVRQVATGFTFTEGPVSDGQGNLYFTDVQQQIIRKIDAEGNVTVFAENSNRANGTAFNQQGELVVCEMAGQIAAWNVQTKERRVVASEYNGTRFNAPNDLVIDAQGGIYFTDPPYAAPQPLPQSVQGVYYISPAGQVTRVVEDLPAPNGIVLSRDGNTLYVLPTGSPEMRSYEVRSPGVLGEEKVFATLRGREGAPAGGSDGGTIDAEGNIYTTTALGIQVISPAGEILGVIELPEQPSNCTFGGPDGKTLYATARTSVYAVPMLVGGVPRAAGSAARATE